MTLAIDKEKWKDILSEISKELTSVSYKTWFMPLIPLEIDENSKTMYVASTDSFKVNVLNKNSKYITLLEDKIKKVYRESYSIRIIHKNDNEINSSSGKAKKTSFSSGNTSMIPDDDPYKEEYFLNPRYNFDNFIIGSNNNYAHAVALAVAESPAKVYNPLFLYGASGLGKTHLMHAIGHYILEHNPDMKVLYVSSEMFTNELLQAMRDPNNSNSRLTSFKQKYRSVDVLLIDDIQFIEGKEATQNEFFYTFNTLYEFGKQIVISSDRSPSKLKDLDDRLKSRFQWNVVADIQPPDFETRVAILLKKAELENIDIENEDVLEVINLIAERVKFNIRELESALTRIISFSKVFNKDINVKFAKESLRDIFSARDAEISCETVKKAVCKKFGIKLSDIESSKRKREYTYPRQIAMYLCREMTDLSLPKIGLSFGGKDHTTVLHACDKIAKDIKTNPVLEEDIRSLKEDIQ